MRNGDKSNITDITGFLRISLAKLASISGGVLTNVFS